MLLTEMVADIKASGFDDMTDATALSLIDRAHKKICAREPFPFLETSADATIDGTGKITNPTNIRALLKVVNETQGYRLVPVRFDALLGARPQMNDAGEAYFYYNKGRDHFVYPGVVANTYHVYYLRRPETIDATNDDALVLVPTEQHELLVLDAIRRAALREDDPEVASAYRAEFEDLYQSSREDLWRRQYDMTDNIADVYWEDDADWVNM